MLLEQETADANAREEVARGNPPLIQACLLGDLEVVCMLLMKKCRSECQTTLFWLDIAPLCKPIKRGHQSRVVDAQ